MSNLFLFIIPLTPRNRLTPNRLALRELCLTTLLQQNYKNWQALLIGGPDAGIPSSTHFKMIEFEGFKEEKMQVATTYILDAHLDADYLIRLDDDDIFNPTLLRQLANKDFDVYLDKFHSFWDVSTGLIAQQVPYWFANTCIHKSKFALSSFGTFPPGKYKRFKDAPLLIENEHNDFHKAYHSGNLVLFSTKNNPVYLRALNPDSLTSTSAGNYTEYMNVYGHWHKNKLNAFQFLKQFSLPQPFKYVGNKQGLLFRIKSWYSNVRALLNYHRVILDPKKTKH